MKKIKGLIFFILLILLVGAVSASEDVNDTISIENDNMELQNDVSDTLSVEEDDTSLNIADNDAQLSVDDNSESTLKVENEDKLAKESDDVLSSPGYIDSPAVSTKTVTGYAGKYITLKATVTDGFGNPLKTTVEFFFNGHTYTRTTNSNGVASVKVKCPSSEVWDTSSKKSGKILTKKTFYKKYYTCEVTAYGEGSSWTLDSFNVISKKPTVVKKYKIIKKKITKTIKVKNGNKLYKWGKYAAATSKYKIGYYTYLESAMGKKNSGLISFFVKHHYKKNGKWKWSSWKKVPKGYTQEFSYGSAVKCDKMKFRYTQVTYKRIK
ncbi:MAG: Ig-like domain-containing protein [Methanobrevibacter sp.]|uniref:Ig-like domain-containing protein n=1 Tax=Methanobrevibacter sp. TaxID=66852 RepID=UPI0025E889A4|nr:Ig-like domain-containing protein [Methanobrevibacter sp.]MBR3113963.1 Ig-like domain-containing protein [Methanobrevibacter sp.]MBR3197561.1 Ig-like domain-containing protein [Methanobrevibacter sp.]